MRHRPRTEPQVIEQGWQYWGVIIMMLGKTERRPYSQEALPCVNCWWDEAPWVTDGVVGWKPPRWRIFASLNSAYENGDFEEGGYLHNYTPLDIADDMRFYDSACEHEDCTSEYLVPYIQEWVDQKKVETLLKKAEAVADEADCAGYWFLKEAKDLVSGGNPEFQCDMLKFLLAEWDEYKAGDEEKRTEIIQRWNK
jgi:hypothetical protein